MYHILMVLMMKVTVTHQGVMALVLYPKKMLLFLHIF